MLSNAACVITGKSVVLLGSQLVVSFLQYATRTSQTTSIFVVPFGEGKSLLIVSSFRAGFYKLTTIDAILLLSLRVFGAAMFAKPAVAHIEEMVRLMHLDKRSGLCREG